MIVTGLFLVPIPDTQEVEGILRPDRGLIEILPPEFGTLGNLYVSDGKLVKEGSPLFDYAIDNSVIRGEVYSEKLELNLQERRTNLENKLVIIDLQEKDLIQAHNLTDSKFTVLLKQHLSTLNILSMNLDESKKEIDGYSKLLAEEVISQLEFNELDRRVFEAQLRLNQKRLEIATLELERTKQLETYKEKLRAFDSSRVDIRLLLGDLNQSLAEIERQKSITVPAPVTGHVYDISAEIGMTIENSKSVLSIVPAGSVVQARFYVPTNKAANLTHGLQVRVMVDAFPHQKYGVVNGTIVRVSSRVYSPTEIEILGEEGVLYFAVDVSMETQSLKFRQDAIPLKTGMSIRGKIRKGHRTAYDILTQKN